MARPFKTFRNSMHMYEMDLRTLQNNLYLLEVSGIAVVDDDGVLVGNVSARDARFVITSEELPKLLHLPLTSFLAVVTAGYDHVALSCKPSGAYQYCSLT